MKITPLAIALVTPILFVACATTQEPAPEVIVIPPEPIRTCAPVSALQRVVIPAETKIQFAITQIENPPYAPIESKVKQTKVVKPAEIIYIDSDGKQILDICENPPVGPTGPGIGEIIQDTDS